VNRLVAGRYKKSPGKNYSAVRVYLVLSAAKHAASSMTAHHTELGREEIFNLLLARAFIHLLQEQISSGVPGRHRFQFPAGKPGLTCVWPGPPPIERPGLIIEPLQDAFINYNPNIMREV